MKIVVASALIATAGASAIGGASEWGEYGLPGMVIFACAAAIGFFMRWLTSLYTKAIADGQSREEALRRENREERDQSRADFLASQEKRDEMFCKEIGGLSEAIRNWGNNS